MSNQPPTRPGAGRMVDPATRANLQALELGGRLLKEGYDAAKSEGVPVSKIARRKERLQSFFKKVDSHMEEIDQKLDKVEPRLDDTMQGVHDVVDAQIAQLKDVEDFVHELAQDSGGHNGAPLADGGTK